MGIKDFLSQQDPQQRQRVGLVVPPANPVIEPEMAALLEPELAVYTSRLPVFDGDLATRNERYLEAYPAAVKSLVGLNLTAGLVAMTGPSYDEMAAGDGSRCEQLTDQFQFPIATSTYAIKQALRDLDIEKIHLVSPYPKWLTDSAVSFWQSAGLSVMSVTMINDGSDNFEAYETSSESVRDALLRVEPVAGSAIVVSGTGLVTLRALYELGHRSVVPVLSSNICGAWWLLNECGLATDENLLNSIDTLIAD